MVYLIVVLALAAALWMLVSRPDPHHAFIISLLPKLDFENAAETSPQSENPPDEGSTIHKTAA